MIAKPLALHGQQSGSALQEVAKLGPTMYMGEAALKGLEISKHDVIAVTNVELLQLQRSDAVRLLGSTFLQLMAQSAVSPTNKVATPCHISKLR